MSDKSTTNKNNNPCPTPATEQGSASESSVKIGKGSGTESPIEVPWNGIRLGEECSGAEIMMRALYQENVKTIFGYPGGAIMPVYDALYTYTQKNDPWFDFVLVRHEQAAAH